MFPLADARGRVIGFQARKLHDDDPLAGKYVNSPESDLFKKSNVLYGLHLARPAIAKQDRAVVVEGNTDVIALPPGGLRAGRRVDGHGAHRAPSARARPADEAPVPLLRRRRGRGGGDAARHGARVRPGVRDPGRRAAPGPGSRRCARAFEQRLGPAESYLHYRVRLELERAADRQEAFVRAREILAEAEDSPERQEALRLVADRLDLPRETLSGIAPARGAAPAGHARRRRRRELLDAGIRLERELLAARRPIPSLRDALAGLTPEHFDSTAPADPRAPGRRWGGRRRSRGASRRARRPRGARRARRANGRELALRLRERKLRRDLQGADLVRATELQAQLAKIRSALPELA